MTNQIAYPDYNLANIVTLAETINARPDYTGHLAQDLLDECTAYAQADHSQTAGTAFDGLILRGVALALVDELADDDVDALELLHQIG